MGRAIYIPVEGPIEILDEQPKFEDLQQYVDGYVQRVPNVPVGIFTAVPLDIPLKDTMYMILICNEDGRHRNLPSNPKANFLLWRYFGRDLVGNIVLLDGFDI